MATPIGPHIAQFEALINVLRSVPHDIFSPFHITRTHYESSGVRIGVDILVPRRKSSTPRPVIVRIHGGFLVSPIFELIASKY